MIPGAEKSRGASYQATRQRFCSDQQGLKVGHRDARADVAKVLPDRQTDGFGDRTAGTVCQTNHDDVTVGRAGVTPEQLLVGAVERRKQGGGTAPRPAIAGHLIDGPLVRNSQSLETLCFAEHDGLGQTVLDIPEADRAVDREDPGVEGQLVEVVGGRTNLSRVKLNLLGCQVID